MKLIIENTSKIVTLKPGSMETGIPARVWEGRTDTGIKVHCYISRVAIDSDEPNSEQFERELQETKVPSPEILAIPSRLIL